MIPRNAWVWLAIVVVFALLLLTNAFGLGDPLK